MKTITEYLPPRRVRFMPTASGFDQLLETCLVILGGESGVLDVSSLRKAVAGRELVPLSDSGCPIVLAHGRTEAVGELMLAAVRSAPSGVEPARMLFAAAIPAAFNTEYLRAVGIIARTCKVEAGSLWDASSPEDFSAQLRRVELSL